MLRKAVGKGAYEMAYSQQENALWVATSQSRSLDKGGVVYRLDPTTLDVTQIIHNDLKPFGATINHATGTLWFGNTVDSTVTAIDAKTGAVKGARCWTSVSAAKPCVRCSRASWRSMSRPTRSTLPVWAKSVIWVVDGATLKLKTTITGTGAMATGLAIDPQAKRLYTTNADGELLTIDSESNTIASRKNCRMTAKRISILT